MPDFELPDQNGVTRRLSEFTATGPVVVFFYPMAMTTGCTKESCHFRDLAAEFAELGASRIGISADGVEKQKKFSDLHSFDYPLLSDSDRVVADIFGVKRRIPGLPNKRATFVIGSDSVVMDAFSSELNMDLHADKALQILRARTGSA